MRRFAAYVIICPVYRTCGVNNIIGFPREPSGLYRRGCVYNNANSVGGRRKIVAGTNVVGERLDSESDIKHIPSRFNCLAGPIHMPHRVFAGVGVQVPALRISRDLIREAASGDMKRPCAEVKYLLAPK